MKTAMQELIDDLKELKKDSKERNQDSSFDIGMTFAIARAELRLEKEKEQIIDATNTFSLLYCIVDFLQI